MKKVLLLTSVLMNTAICWAQMNLSELSAIHCKYMNGTKLIIDSEFRTNSCVSRSLNGGKMTSYVCPFQEITDQAQDPRTLRIFISEINHKGHFEILDRNGEIDFLSPLNSCKYVLQSH